MAREPFLPLFFGDFLSATSEWEGEEQALYLLLLGHQWAIGSLPADPHKLCKLARWDWELFSRFWPTVSQKFEPMANAIENDGGRHQSANSGRLQNARLEAHRAKASRLSVTNSAAGKKGAEARWSHKNGASMANAMQNDGERHQDANGATPMAPSHPNPILKNSLSRAREEVSRGTMDSTRVELDDVPTQLLTAIKGIHPRGTYRQAAWLLTEREIRTSLEEGYSAEEIFGGYKRYALQAEATGSVGTQYVIGPDRFARERMFREPFPIPTEEKRGKGLTRDEQEQEDMRKLMARRAGMGLADFRDPNPGETADEYRRAQNAEWNARQPRDVAGVARQLAQSKAVA